MKVYRMETPGHSLHDVHPLSADQRRAGVRTEAPISIADAIGFNEQRGGGGVSVHRHRNLRFDVSEIVQDV